MGVSSAAEVKRAYTELIERAQQGRQEAPPSTACSCARLVSGGVETVVGVSTDELFGPVVMFGLGGVFVEVFEDVTFRVPPFDKDEAHRMVARGQGLQAARRCTRPEAGERSRPSST